jgi:hypothetical protein
MLLKNLLIGALMLSPFSGAYAIDTADDNENATLIRAFFNLQVSPWVQDDALLSAIRVRNVINKDLTQDDIDALDKQWRAEVETDTHPLVDATMSGDAADFLRHRVADSGGTITEIIVMDAKGLNVAVSSPTSDYWQGDEAKHAETYAKGADALHMSELEVDGSTGVYQVQVSYTITDPLSGEAIGAITVGLIADAIL